MSVLSRREATSLVQRTTTQEKILDAAVTLLDSGGAFAEITVGAIAEQASVSRPTFYAYFRDKRDLVLALGDRFEREAHQAADDWLSLRADDLEAALVGVLESFRAQQGALKAITEAAGYDSEVAAFWRAFHERFIVGVAGRARREDPSRAEQELQAEAFALVWMTERCFTEHLEAPRVSDDALIRALVRLWHSTF
ncbi:MAG: TetR/AcrR family transcriptional regulator [Thermoleophilaceae bacterium]|nr:TetR/AcrR family transcriptional regulator [Thermoleophilaceae bacterium]